MYSKAIITLSVGSLLSFLGCYIKSQMSSVFLNVNEQTTLSVVLLYKYRAVAKLLWKGFSACGRFGASVED